MRHVVKLAFPTFIALLLGPATFAPSPRPAITGLCFVRFKVSSIGAADKFYGNNLGLPRTNECWGQSPETCFLITPYQDVEILEDNTSQGISLLETVGIWTSDAGILHSYLLARGLHPGELTSQFKGEDQFEISDSEDHRLLFLSLIGASKRHLETRTQASHHMIHSGLVVHDRAAEDKFYKDILGFHVYWHGGMKDGEDHWIDMQVPDGTDWIEYMLKVAADASKHTLGVMNHIALGVPDIHAAEKQLRANGWKGAEEPKIGRDGKWQLNLYDPDDTRVEFMEFTPTQKPCCSEYTGPHPGPESPSKAPAKP